MNIVKDFSELNFVEKIQENLKKIGFVKPTEIQSQMLPYALSNDEDIFGQAPTGTGKTACFALPIVESIFKQKADHVQAIVIVPTRELAIQIARDFKLFSQGMNLKVATLYGGQNILLQMGDLRQKANIVVGTPGRILDHIKRKTLVLSKSQFLVLDEADEMLNVGFVEDIENIMNALPQEKRTFMFSATNPPSIKNLIKRHGDQKINFFFFY